MKLERGARAPKRAQVTKAIEDVTRSVEAEIIEADVPAHAFKIERDVPLHKVRTRTPSTQYPLDALNVGESFHFEYGSKKAAAMERVRVQARRLAPKKFAMRSEGSGLRVWRTE